MSNIRKNIRRVLRKTGLMRLAEPAYMYVNYYWYGNPTFNYELHPDITKFTPSSWAKTHNESQPEFFGYYDKSPWSPSGNSLVYHNIVRDDLVSIQIYNRKSNDKKVINKTKAWNYQQGAMAQWLSNDEIIFNDICDKKLVARIVDRTGREKQLLPFPVQTLHRESNEFLSLNYRRLDRLQPQYGYGKNVINFKKRQKMESDGIWKVSIDSTEAELLFTLKYLSENQTRSEMKDAVHKLNHIMYSPNGSKFVFMHRWIGSDGRFSRLYVSDSDGGNLKLLMDDQLVSHYSWKNNRKLIVWGRGEEGDLYYEVDVETADQEVINSGLNRYGDGHPSYSPDGRWIVTDTYADEARVRKLLLHDTDKQETIEIGRFHSPIRFRGEKSCDLHPRWNRDGTMISIDSTHEGSRSTYLIDVSKIVET